MSYGWWIDVDVRCTTIQVVIVWELCWFRVCGCLIIVGTLVGHSLAQPAAFWAERGCHFFKLWVAFYHSYVGTNLAEIFFVVVNINYFSDGFRFVNFNFKFICWKPLVWGTTDLFFANLHWSNCSQYKSIVWDKFSIFLHWVNWEPTIARI